MPHPHCPTCHLDLTLSVARGDAEATHNQECGLCATLRTRLTADGHSREQVERIQAACSRHYQDVLLDYKGIHGYPNDLPKRLFEGTINDIPAPIRGVLDESGYLNALRGGGKLPPVGLALSAQPRVGKSSALAALTHYWRSRVALHYASRNKVSDDRVRVLWVDWHATALRIHTSQDDVVGDLLRSADLATLVVLDDVGLEGAVNYHLSGDPLTATLTLQALIWKRHDARRPLWWTTNLSTEGVVARYGEALSDRLMAMAPLHEFPNLAHHPLNK